MRYDYVCNQMMASESLENFPNVSFFPNFQNFQSI